MVGFHSSFPRGRLFILLRLPPVSEAPSHRRAPIRGNHRHDPQFDDAQHVGGYGIARVPAPKRAVHLGSRRFVRQLPGGLLPVFYSNQAVRRVAKALCRPVCGVGGVHRCVRVHVGIRLYRIDIHVF